ncbi:MAG: glycosyltransferase family 39 protein [Anaerolineales bacterium]|nr:glycosyltransferase family 39 protein [Anaerolineales bacterium]
MTKPTSQTWLLTVIILLSIMGGFLITYSTANGPWGYTDPVEYISSARNLLAGRGLGYFQGDARFDYTTIHPPFYSLVLSAIGLLRVDLVIAARWLNMISFIGSIFIAGWIFFKHSQEPTMSIIASAMMCVFPSMVIMFSSSMSEPLFIILSLIEGLCLLAYLSNGKTSLLVISGLIAGLVPFTRLAGIAMLFAGVVSVLLFSSGRRWQRIGKVLLFVGIGSLPLVLWLVWVYFIEHSVGGRNVSLDFSTLVAHFQNFRAFFMDTVWEWIPFQKKTTMLKYSLRFVLLGIGAIVTAGLSFLAWRDLRKDTTDGKWRHDALILIYFGLTATVYIAFLIATYLLTLPTIDIDNRMLLPFYVASVMMLLGAFSLWKAAWLRGVWVWVRGLPWLILILCVYWYFPKAQEIVDLYHSGDGLTAYHWDRSEIINAIRALPEEQPVISNDWELVMLWTDRPIYGLWLTFPTNPFQEGCYGTNSADPLQAFFCEQGAALVIFNDFSSQVSTQIGESYLNQVPALFEGLFWF